MRKTKQREVILEELMRLHSHPSAVELYDIVRKRLSRISLGTVYRNLEILSREGAIRRLELGRSEMRFDGDLSEHRHVRCVHCGRVQDVGAGAGLTEGDRKMLGGMGYRVLGKRVEFIGLCPRCRRDRKRAGSA